MTSESRSAVERVCSQILELVGEARDLTEDIKILDRTFSEAIQVCVQTLLTGKTLCIMHTFNTCSQRSFTLQTIIRFSVKFKTG